MAAVFHILVAVKAWASVFQKGSVLVYIESFLAKKASHSPFSFLRLTDPRIKRSSSASILSVLLGEFSFLKLHWSTKKEGIDWLELHFSVRDYALRIVK